MRGSRGWWWEPCPGFWVAQRGRGPGHQLEELALVLTGVEGEDVWVGLLRDSKVLPAHVSNQ